MLQWLQGKKTYIIALVMILMSAFLFSSGIVTPPGQEQSQTVLVQVNEAAILQIQPNPGVQEILGYLAPLIVIGVTQLIRKVSPQLSGWVITFVIVPIASAVLAWLATMIIGEMSWLQQFLLGLLSVFLVELKKQLSQGNDKSPEYNKRVATR